MPCLRWAAGDGYRSRMFNLVTSDESGGGGRRQERENLRIMHVIHLLRSVAGIAFRVSRDTDSDLANSLPPSSLLRSLIARCSDCRRRADPVPR